MAFGIVRTKTKVANHKSDHKKTLDAKDDMYKGKPDSAGKTYQEKTRNMSKDEKEKYRQENPGEYAAYKQDKDANLPGYSYYKDGKKDITDQGGVSGFMQKGSTQLFMGGAPLLLMGAPMLMGSGDKPAEEPAPPLDPTTNGMPPVTA